MSHQLKSSESYPPLPIPEQASLGTDKGSKVLMWISGVGLVALLIAVVVVLWQEKPAAPPPGDAAIAPASSQPILRLRGEAPGPSSPGR